MIHVGILHVGIHVGMPSIEFWNDADNEGWEGQNMSARITSRSIEREKPGPHPTGVSPPMPRSIIVISGLWPSPWLVISGVLSCLASIPEWSATRTPLCVVPVFHLPLWLYFGKLRWIKYLVPDWSLPFYSAHLSLPLGKIEQDFLFFLILRD